MADRSFSSVGSIPREVMQEGVSCVEEFREDELLLRQGVPTVRVSVLSGLTVSYGVGVPDDAPYLLRARAAGVATVRRTSGGTGVVHAPGDLAWSVVLPRSDPRVGNDFVRAYARLGAGVVGFLRRHGVVGRWADSPGLTPDFCVLSDRGQVLSANSRILGGAAQHLSRAWLLHQGMIPLEVDRDLITRVFELTDREILDRLVGLTELGIQLPPVQVARQLASEFARELAGASP
jgi:lipoate-protein ligase A